MQVQVTNTFHLGSVLVTKHVDGPGADLYGQGPFEVSLACTSEDTGTKRDIAIPGGAVRTLSSENDLTTRYDQLPVGAACALTETGAGGATSSTVAVTTDGGSPVTTQGNRTDLVVVDDTASSGDGLAPGVSAEITNRFGLGEVRVTKRLTGIGADYVDGPFTVRIECIREVDGRTVPVAVPGRSRPHSPARRGTQRPVERPADRGVVRGERAQGRRSGLDEDQPGADPGQGRGQQHRAGGEQLRRQCAATRLLRGGLPPTPSRACRVTDSVGRAVRCVRG